MGNNMAIPSFAIAVLHTIMAVTMYIWYDDYDDE